MTIARSPTFYFALAIAASPMAIAEPFVLTNTELDRVTAAGVSVVADGFSASASLGDVGVADSITDASVNPERGTATAFAVGVGPDGSSALADTSGTGSKPGITGAGAILTTSATRSADAVDAFSTYLLNLDENQASSSGDAIALGDETLIDLSTGLSGQLGATDLVASATASGAGDFGGAATGSNLTAAVGNENGMRIYSRAGVSAPNFTTSNVDIQSSTELGGIVISLEAGAGGAADLSSNATATNVILSSEGGIIARASGSFELRGGQIGTPLAYTGATIGGVSDPSMVATIDRSISRPGRSRSTKIFVIPR